MAVHEQMTERSDEAARSRNRRQLIGAGFAAAAGVAFGASRSYGASRANTDQTTAGWLSYVSVSSGAGIQYPPTWFLDPCSTLDVSLDPSLIYPHQSFGVRTNSAKPTIDTSDDGGGMPDLTSYPADGAIVWLMHYDDIVEGGSFSGVTLGSLDLLVSEFANFDSYLARFSGSERSFLLRVWVGADVDAATRQDIDTSLQTMSVP